MPTLAVVPIWVPLRVRYGRQAPSKRTSTCEVALSSTHRIGILDQGVPLVLIIKRPPTTTVWRLGNTFWINGVVSLRPALFKLSDWPLLNAVVVDTPTQLKLPYNVVHLPIRSPVAR